MADDKSIDETCPSVTTVGDFDNYLDPGESITCSATYTVTAQDMVDGFVTNTASAAADGLTSNTDSVTVNSPGADLSITKTDTPDPVTAGQTITYTLQVTNNGPSNASSITVTDTLPASTTYLTASGTGWSCSHAAGVVTCTRASLTIGAAPNITITVTAPAQGGSITNTATVSATTTDPNNTNNSASATTTVNASADLSITKTDSPDPVTAGQNLTYTVTVTNAGPSDAANVVVTDTLPAGVTFVATTGCSNDPNGVPTCNLGTIAAGGNQQYTVTVTVNAGTSGTLTNTVSVTSSTPDPNAANNSASATTTVNASADLSITKTADNMAPALNGTVIFTLTVTNNGPSDATGVAVTDLLPSGLSYVSDTSGGAYNSSTGLWDIGTLTIGSSESISITVTVDDPGRIVNIASITDKDVPDPDQTNNSSGLILNAGANEADLSVIKQVNNPTPGLTENIIFTITVTNNGPDNATGVTLTDILPAGLTYISDNSGGDYIPGTGIWTIGTLNVNNSVILQITAQVDNAGEIINLARITSLDQTDPDVTNNHSSAVINQTHPVVADLAVQKTVNQDTVPIGDTVIFTIVVRNNGPDDAANVVINDSLPAGMNYISSSPSQGSYDNGTGVWTVGVIPADGYVLLDIVAQMNNVNPQINTASGSSDTFDPDTTNNTDDATVSTDSADLSITKTDSPDPVTAGQNLTYTVTVTNAGPSDAANVVVTDTLPAGVTFVATTGCSNDPNGVPTCNLGKIAAGGNRQYTVTVTVNAGTSGTLTNTVSVTSSTPDPNAANNSASATTTVNASSIPVAVPTMSEWGFIILVVLQGIAALFYLRRRARS